MPSNRSAASSRTHDSKQYFKFGKMDASAKHVPNPQLPVVFTLRKMGNGAELISTEFPLGMPS